MKRKTFLKALAGVVIAPTLLANVKEKEIIKETTFVSKNTFNKIDAVSVNTYGINVKHLNGRNFIAHPLFGKYASF